VKGTNDQAIYWRQMGVAVTWKGEERKITVCLFLGYTNVFFQEIKRVHKGGKDKQMKQEQ